MATAAGSYVRRRFQGEVATPQVLELGRVCLMLALERHCERGLDLCLKSIPIMAKTRATHAMMKLNLSCCLVGRYRENHLFVDLVAGS
jgi:hypothetical protein